MKYLIAYHDNCTDGFTAAWVVRNYIISNTYKDDRDILTVGLTYGQDHESQLRSLLHEHQSIEIMYIVDFYVSLQVMNNLICYHPNKLKIHVYDHHYTAMKPYNGNVLDSVARWKFENINIVIDQRVSGALLAWQELYGPSKCPMLVDYVSDYDLWKFELKDTKILNKYISSLPRSFAVWDKLAKDIEIRTRFNAILLQGGAIQTYHDKIVNDLVATRVPIELAGAEGLVVNCPPMFASDVGNKLAKLSGTYGATWSQASNKVKYSLRSKDHYNVAELAEKFGGGGHKNAAGFTLAVPQEGEIFPDEESAVGVTLWRT